MRVHTKGYIAIKMALSLIAVLLVISCAQMEPYVAIFQNWDYSFNDGGMQFASLGDLESWVHNTIIYKSDKQAWGWTEYWASPALTLATKEGDCEDHALLFMYLAHARHLASDPELVGIIQQDGVGHAIVRIGDTYYDPTNGTTYSAALMTDSMLFTLSYGQAMYIAVNDHDAYQGIARAKGILTGR